MELWVHLIGKPSTQSDGLEYIVHRYDAFVIIVVIWKFLNKFILIVLKDALNSIELACNGNSVEYHVLIDILQQFALKVFPSDTDCLLVSLTLEV